MFVAGAWAERRPAHKPKTIQVIEHGLSQYTPTNVDGVSIEVGRWIDRDLRRQGLRSPKDGTPLDLLTFRGSKGDVVTARVESDDFDPLTWLMDAERWVLLQGDDDSGNGTNARLTTVLPRRGDYWLAVNSHGKGGSYRVRVDKEPPLLIPTKPAVSKRRAVLLGINDYPGTPNDLSAPVHDVDAVRELLENLAGFEPDDILVIKDHYATRENVMGAIRSFLKPVPSDGTIIIYFSGHGIQLTFRGGGRPGLEQAEDEADRRDEALWLADGSNLADHELRQLVECTSANAVTVIVDACYSGGMHRGSGQKNVSEKHVKKYLDLAGTDRPPPCLGDDAGTMARKVDLVVAASQENERAWEWEGWKDLSNPRSVFTYYLIQGLQEALASPSGVSVEALSSAVSDKTTQFTEDKKDAPQNVRLVNFSKRAPLVKDLFGLPETSAGSE